jgi:hypothetical protein
MSKSIRKLKIYGHYSQYAKYHKIGDKGAWLQEFGFNIGDSIVVRVREGWIAITKDETGDNNG